MSVTPLPRIIEPLKLVEQRVDLQGVIELSQLDRLQGVTLEQAGEVQVFLRFGKDEQGIRTITGSVAADLLMECQRCLQPVVIHVHSEVNLGLVFSEEAVKNLPSHYEPLQLEGQHIELKSIIEDELIIGLPLISAHPENECSIDDQYSAQPSGKEQAASNPFSVLAELKKPD
jgi:uncharacterized protein